MRSDGLEKEITFREYLDRVNRRALDTRKEREAEKKKQFSRMPVKDNEL